MNQQTTDQFLSTLGYLRTQPGYYEPKEDSKLFAICDDNKLVTFYDGKTDENTSLIPVQTLEVPLTIYEEWVDAFMVTEGLDPRTGNPVQ